MQVSQITMDELFVEKVVAARKRTFEQKFLAAGELFEAVTERMRAGILIQQPHATEAQIRVEIQRRLAIARVLENHREPQ